MPDVSATIPTQKPSTNQVGWGPAVAVVATVFIYFASQIVSSFIIIGIASLRSLDHAQTKLWLDTVPIQFAYVLFAEATAIGLLWAILHYYKAGFKAIGWRRPRWSDLGWAVIVLFVYFTILLVATSILTALVPSINIDQPQQIGFDGAHGPALILVFFSLTILPAVTEELLVRGFLFSGLRSKLPVIQAAIITSLIFATAHLQIGSGQPLLWTAALDTFILSLALIWLRQKTNGLMAPIFLHILKNSLAFIALFIFKG